MDIEEMIIKTVTTGLLIWLWFIFILIIITWDTLIKFIIGFPLFLFALFFSYIVIQYIWR